MNPNTGPDVMEQLPAGGNPSTPPSGSYGDKADADRLRQALNLPGGQGGPPPAGPSPTPGGMPSPSPGTATQVPDLLLRPTTQPNVAPSTPLRGPAPVATNVTAAQRRLAWLDALSTNPDVSEETREWAELVLDKLSKASRG